MRAVDSKVFSKILADMNEEGGFSASVLSDTNGFPLASAVQSQMDAEYQAAVVAQMQKAVNQLRGQLGLGATEEISVFDTQGQRLVCRMFTLNQQELILAIMVPARTQSYRRVTGSAIQAICRNWLQ